MISNFFKNNRIIVIVLIGVLYFSGIAAIVYPMISNVVSLSTSKTTISDYVEAVKQMPDEEIADKFRLADKYNSDIAKGEYNDGYEHSLCDKGGVMCYVDIPTVSIYLPVYYGTSDDVLQKGAGCLENTSLPVGGESTHSVISAHTGLPTAEMFTKLDQVNEGDVFYIHVLDRILAYRVDQIEAVTPNKTELLEIKKGMDYCTLLTCTPYGINDKRLLVRGVRIPYNSGDNTDEAVQPGLNASSGQDQSDEELAENIRHQTFIIAVIIIGSVVVYAGALIWLLLTVKGFGRGKRYAAEDK